MADKPNKIRRPAQEAQADERRDDARDAPGAASHPVGTGAGAASGAVGGAALGAVAGPAGMAAGAVLGGLVGGLAGNLIAQGVNPEAEHEYWRTHFRQRQYIRKDQSYERYAPAYQYGWESYVRHTGEQPKRPSQFDEVAAQLGRDWESHRGPNDLPWDEAQHATRDAWERVHGSLAESRDRTPQTDDRPAPDEPYEPKRPG